MRDRGALELRAEHLHREATVDGRFGALHSSQGAVRLRPFPLAPVPAGEYYKSETFSERAMRADDRRYS